MAYDFGSMVQRILTDLNRGTSHTSRVKEAIIDAIRFYRNRRFGFNQKSAQAVLDPNQELIVLPTGWIEVDHLRLADKQHNRFSLQEKGFVWIEDRYQGGSWTGQPKYYSIQNRQLRLYPVPDTSYSLVMSFLYELRDVSISATNGATNAWMTEGEELIRKHAMSDLMVLYIGGDQILPGKALRQECSDEIAVALESQAARETSAGQIRPFL